MKENDINFNDEIQELEEESDKNIKYSELSRREIRSLIFHILYAYDSFDYNVSLESIIDNLNRGFDLDIPLDSEVVFVAKQVADSQNALDKVIAKFLANWRLERLGVATKLILRIGTWEFLNTDTPTTVVINEAVELAKCFAEIDAYKFINGILDEIAKKLQELKEEFKI